MSMDASSWDLESSEYFIRLRPPKNDETLPSYPLKTFFLDYMPRWSHIYSNEIPRTEYYRKISNYIAEGKDVIVYGIV